MIFLDQDRFRLACTQVGKRAGGGIGTLGEKTLHAALKYYLEPTGQWHEIRVGSYVADIADGRGILEIQTRGFDRLRKKLPAFLAVGPVTVVYPIPALKWLVWVDAVTGETTTRRKSPKHAGPCEILPELYKIRTMLSHPNLSLHLVLLEVEETRWLNGWSDDRKKGSTRCDRVPLSLLEEILLTEVKDFGVFLPHSLPERFNSVDYQRASGLSRAKAQTALNVLHGLGVVERVERTAKGYLYFHSYKKQA